MLVNFLPSTRGMAVLISLHLQYGSLPLELRDQTSFHSELIYIKGLLVLFLEPIAPIAYSSGFPFYCSVLPLPVE